MIEIINIIDIIIFTILSLCVLYMLIYSISSHFYKEPLFKSINYDNRIAVFFPAYKEDSVIVNSIKSFLNQEYSKKNYDVIVISDQMKIETIELLKQFPVTILEVSFENSSKAKALSFGINSLENNNYDIFVIMDADNIVESNFLSKINQAINNGCEVIQGRRKGKKSSSNVAHLDTISEEINNSIFRSGHNALNLSAALSGSGMAFKSDWLIKNISKIYSAGEDKELEALLLKENIPVGGIKLAHI